MPENERALSERVLELEAALSAQHEAIESLRWARAQLERALQRVGQERDEAREDASRLQAELDRQRALSEPPGPRATGKAPRIEALPAEPGPSTSPTIRLLALPEPATTQNNAPTVPAPPRERAVSVTRGERREAAADSGTYSVLDVGEERVRPLRRRRVAR
ncbi:MAG: hypothetical protein R3B89_00175 [Polyangiaceae bacterium]